ncbi:progranulin-like [Kryptolebias marmoratus]|uniref:Family with sequence similarity 133 member B n=1 Tax=Kryptolebias marmoratus TaxID=37003 RepID=A0A3Q2ZCT6_KRYMA|nr:progranulin-like [Kryptolebias marmoratus]
MLRLALWLHVGACVWGFAFCLRCPDGSVCSNLETCCQTEKGYACCPYPNAVCCSDMANCCPQGYSCDLALQLCVKEYQPWLTWPMLRKVAAEAPGAADLSVSPFQELKSNDPPERNPAVVHCNTYYACPDGTTCCWHPKGGWFCCPYSPGRCCLDGYRCCPYGFDCDYTYTHCVREGLTYPFSPRQALASVPASLVLTPEDESGAQETPLTALTEASRSHVDHGVIRCDNEFFCPVGSSCCKGLTGQWNCCSHPLGTCCADGRHCCAYGYQCDPSSSKCTK